MVYYREQKNLKGWDFCSKLTRLFAVILYTISHAQSACVHYYLAIIVVYFLIL